MRYSLKSKAIALIIVLALILSALSIFVSVRFVSNIIRDNYETESARLSQTAANVVDAEALARLKAETKQIYDSIPAEERVSSDDWGSDAFNKYISYFEGLSGTDDYKTIYRQLRQIQDANDVDCIYAVFVDADTEAFIYLVDAAEEEPCPIGCFDPVYEENKRVLEDPAVGFPTYTTNTEEYGYLATTGTPVYDSSGEVAGYTMVDISMDNIAAWQKKLSSRLIGLELIVTALVIFFSVLLVNRALVRPINQLSRAAREYSSDKDLSAHNHFSRLDIHTHDEIGDLTESMKAMEQDLNDKITRLFHTTNELSASRQEASRMNELALMDALTGVRNKRAYDSAIDELAKSLTDDAGSSQEFGLAVIDLNGLKKINDTYGHEKGDIAIKELCRVVCRVFAHSPVYRIGGDEFAVILKGHDLENIDQLVERLSSELSDMSNDDSRQPWERVSAAIGYAIYDAERDDSTGNIFRRADRAMYMRKQEMKSGKSL